MNPLKKLKLKSQLRNCDYLLAGNVIKQQYYDANKSTVINRLIDEFMSAPGFDSALKLIEYNDMMVFYFTESCAGGLYIRKQDPYKTGPFVPIQPDTLQQPSEGFLTPPLESPLGVMKDEASGRSEKQRQILEESEAWMDQIIANGSRKQSSFSDSVRESSTWNKAQSEAEISSTNTTYRAGALDDLPELDLEETLVIRPVKTADNYWVNNEADDFAGSSVDSYAQTNQEDQAIGLSVDLVDDLSEGLAVDSAADPIEVILSEPVISVIEEQPVHSEPMFAQPEAVASVPVRRPSPKKRSYSNVIATLQIDIHTMSKQLEEYRRELSYYPNNEKQLISWIHSLETAIEEFSEVVDLLEDEY